MRILTMTLVTSLALSLQSCAAYRNEQQVTPELDFTSEIPRRAARLATAGTL